MTTTHNADTTVDRIRKRPSSNTPAARTARQEFGNQFQKQLPIPLLVDSYNHNMNAVDIADQLRAGSIGNLRRSGPGGFYALFNFLFDLVLVNSYKLSIYSKEQRHGQHSFRIRLYIQLFQVAKEEKRVRKPVATKGVIRGMITPECGLQTLQKQESCVVCPSSPLKKRAILGETDLNTPVRKRRRRTTYGCSHCKVALCKDGRCWDIYHQIS